MFAKRSIYKTAAQLDSMREPGRITSAALEAVRQLIKPGITTAELDQAAYEVIISQGAKSNFQMVRGYHHTVCVSVNEQVVHGIPGNRVIEPGDIVSVDAGAQFKGWNGDSAITVVVPDPSRPELVARRNELSDVTRGSLWAGIAAMASADTVGDIGSAIEDYILAQPVSSVSGKPFGILREYVGHGIGRKMHEAPTLFNYRTPEPGPRVKSGLVLAIEPMIVAGSEQTFVEPDEWTVSTTDGSDGSHWEHSVARHDGGIWVLTAPDGGRAGLAPFGIEPVEIGK